MNAVGGKTKGAGYLLCVQVLCALILLQSEFLEPALVQASYCTVVFLSPPLLLGYGRRYLREPPLHGAIVPFCGEFALAILFVSVAVYGINSPECDGPLFARLLGGYALDVVLCSVGLLVSTKE